MASVTVPTVLIAPADDLAAQIELDVSALSDEDGVMGEVRTYASGRRRSVSRVGRARSLPIAFDVVGQRDLLALIKSWCGLVVFVRDPRGRKVWGVYYSVTVKEAIVVDKAEVSFTLTEITYDESV